MCRCLFAVISFSITWSIALNLNLLEVKQKRVNHWHSCKSNPPPPPFFFFSSSLLFLQPYSFFVPILRPLCNKYSKLVYTISDNSLITLRCFTTWLTQNCTMVPLVLIQTIPFCNFNKSTNQILFQEDQWSHSNSSFHPWCHESKFYMKMVLLLHPVM